jgi:hypothetical protein
MLVTCCDYIEKPLTSSVSGFRKARLRCLTPCSACVIIAVAAGALSELVAGLEGFE